MVSTLERSFAEIGLNEQELDPNSALLQLDKGNIRYTY